MNRIIETYIKDDRWDSRPLDNPPQVLTAVIKINYTVDQIIDFLDEIDDPDEPPRLYTLDDLVQVVQDWASEDLVGIEGFYIETDDGKVVG